MVASEVAWWDGGTYCGELELQQLIWTRVNEPPGRKPRRCNARDSAPSPTRAIVFAVRRFPVCTETHYCINTRA